MWKTILSFWCTSVPPGSDSGTNCAHWCVISVNDPFVYWIVMSFMVFFFNRCLLCLYTVSCMVFVYCFLCGVCKMFFLCGVCMVFVYSLSCVVFVYCLLCGVRKMFLVWYSCTVSCSVHVLSISVFICSSGVFFSIVCVTHSLSSSVCLLFIICIMKLFISLWYQV